MQSKYSVKLKTVVEELQLKPVFCASDYNTCVLRKSDINRPAMQITGFYYYFDPSRLQIIGRLENLYLELLPAEKRRRSLESLMQYDVPAFIFCHDVKPTPDFVELAKKYDRSLFLTDEDTSAFSAKLILSLQQHLAPRLTTHGVLVEVYGEGVLLLGNSGIGKSETALELIKRGHRLIADDAVEIRLIDRKTLVGTAPAMIRYYMELRGIGVINVRHIYGVGAVKPESNIDLVIKMEPWEEGKSYDRLGLSSDVETILGVQVPSVIIPVAPGRNLAVIMELAAMNNRQKKMGFNAAETLAAEHDRAIDEGLF